MHRYKIAFRANLVLQNLILLFSSNVNNLPNDALHLLHILKNGARSYCKFIPDVTQFLAFIFMLAIYTYLIGKLGFPQILAES
jgi:hypothetical protein